MLSRGSCSITRTVPKSPLLVDPGVVYPPCVCTCLLRLSRGPNTVVPLSLLSLCPLLQAQTQGSLCLSPLFPAPTCNRCVALCTQAFHVEPCTLAFVTIWPPRGNCCLPQVCPNLVPVCPQLAVSSKSLFLHLCVFPSWVSTHVLRCTLFLTLRFIRPAKFTRLSNQRVFQLL